jgi:two-component sensor histidine kinase
MDSQFLRRPQYPIVLAAVLVAMSFALRLGLTRYVGPTGHTFTFFYLAVAVAAYFGGPTCAILTMVVSATSAYWAFAAPEFSWEFDHRALIAMGSFALTSAIYIYFITGMRQAIRRYRMERTRAEILAQGHAALFHEYNERAANFLQLLGAMLRKETAETTDPQLIMEASRRTMLLSSVHRSMSPQTESQTDFAAFAKELIETVMRTAGISQATVEVEDLPRLVPADRAASMAVLLSEWSRLCVPSLMLARRPHVTVSLETDDEGQHLRLSAHGWSGDNGGLQPRDLADQIITAMADQLAGQHRSESHPDALHFTLSCPHVSPEQRPIDPASILIQRGSQTLQ